jgi:hypothetical protein
MNRLAGIAIGLLTETLKLADDCIQNDHEKKMLNLKIMMTEETVTQLGSLLDSETRRADLAEKELEQMRIKLKELTK